MLGTLFKTGDVGPVSGNYQFVKHEELVEGCIPRPRAYLHLRKGTKIPGHDECLQSAVYRLMTITSEENEPKIVQGM